MISQTLNDQILDEAALILNEMIRNAVSGFYDHILSRSE